MHQLNEFVSGWRGFLVGNRRSWHAHHRWGVTGFRGGHLVARESVQAGQLRRVAGLLTEVFARGGTVWSFGMGHRGDPAWGLVRPAWRPGVLSNCFFSRLKRTHFVRRLARVFHVRPRRRRSELSTRWVRLRERGGLPRNGFAVRTGFTGALTRLVRGSSLALAAPVRSPRTARLRTRWFRSWWAAAPGAPPIPGGRHPWAVPARRVYSPAARAIRHAQAVRTGRRRPAGMTRRGGVARTARRLTPAGVSVPHRGGGRHQRWPVAFPAVVLAGGLTLLKTTLLNEVNSAGLLFVRFGGVDFAPRSGLFEVYWNPRAAAVGGVPGWTDDLFVRAVRAGLFRTCWRRLARLAER